MVISLAALGFAMLGMGISTLSALGISLAALGFRMLGLVISTLSALGISLAALGFAVLGVGISTLNALGIVGISLAALGFRMLGLVISFTPDGSTIASAVTTLASFTSIAGSTSSTLTVLDTFFFESVLLFFTSMPSLEASFTSSLGASFAMIGGLATSFTPSFTGALGTSALGKAGAVTGSLGAIL